MITGHPAGDPRRTLADEYADRGLIRPNQFSKLPRAVREADYELVQFVWGRHKVNGYRLKSKRTRKVGK